VEEEEKRAVGEFDASAEGLTLDQKRVALEEKIKNLNSTIQQMEAFVEDKRAEHTFKTKPEPISSKDTADTLDLLVKAIASGKGLQTGDGNQFLYVSQNLNLRAGGALAVKTPAGPVIGGAAKDGKGLGALGHLGAHARPNSSATGPPSKKQAVGSITPIPVPVPNAAAHSGGNSVPGPAPSVQQAGGQPPVPLSNISSGQMRRIAMGQGSVNYADATNGQPMGAVPGQMLGMPTLYPQATAGRGGQFVVDQPGAQQKYLLFQQQQIHQM